MRKNVMLLMWFCVLLAAAGVQTATAGVTVAFPNTSGADAAGIEDVTLAFAIDGTGLVSLDASTNNAGATEAEIAVVDGWDSANVGSVSNAALYGETFTLTITASGSLNVRTTYGGELGIAGNNAGAVDGDEELNFTLSGNAGIGLNITAFGYANARGAGGRALEVLDADTSTTFDKNSGLDKNVAGTIDLTGLGYSIADGGALTFAGTTTDTGNATGAAIQSVSFDVQSIGANNPPVVNASASPLARPESPAAPVDPARPIVGEGIHLVIEPIDDPNVSLDAGAIDEDALTYAWTVISAAPGATVFGFEGDLTGLASTSAGETPQFFVDSSVLGDYVLRVSVSDGTNPAVTDDVTVTALDNWAPTGGIQGDNISEIYYDEVIQWLANSNDTEDPCNLSLVWSVIENTSVDGSIEFYADTTIEDPCLMVTVPTTPANAAGEYTLQLVITDTGTPALTRIATKVLTVIDNDIDTLIVDAGEDAYVAISEGGTLVLAGYAEDDGYPLDPGEVTTTWSATGPADVDFTPDENDPLATATFDTVGVYELLLTADDGGGNPVSDTVVVTVTPNPVEVVEFGAEDDTWVKSDTDDNYGADTSASVKNTNRVAYFQFDIYGNVPGAVYTAELRMKSNDDIADAQVFAVTYGPSGDWDEGTGTASASATGDGLTWNNNDLVVGALLDQITPITADWYDFDVSGMVIENDGQVTFMVTAPGEDNNRRDWATKESDDAPQLVILYDPAVPYGPLPIDTAVERHPDTELSWYPGDVVSATNTLYFGTDDDPYANPDIIRTVTKGEPNDLTFDLSTDYPGGLAVGVTYYWGVNNSENDGKVWSFTVMENHPDLPLLVSPVDGAEGLLVPDDVVFEWVDGQLADSGHHLYLSVNQTLVDDLDTGVKTSNVTSPYEPNDALAPVIHLDAIHYWRIQGEDGSGNTWESPVWSFTTGNEEIIEDFEDGVWPGSTEELIRKRNGSDIAMRITYSGAEASATKTFDYPRDWSGSTGRRSMRLYIHGDEGNSADPVFVSLNDGSGESSRVYIDDPTLLQHVIWRPFVTWNIDLDDFTGIDRSSIVSMTIGVEGVGSGHIIIDDMSLFAPRCVGEYADADFTGNCISEPNDLFIMADWWLKGEVVVNAEALSPTGLLAHWAFEDDLIDASSTWTLTAVGTTSFVAGPTGLGQALNCDSIGHVETADANEIAGTILDKVSVSLWAKANVKVDPSKGKIETSDLFEFENGQDPDIYVNNNASGTFRFNAFGNGMAEDMTDEALTEWTHYAFVADGSTGRNEIYVDGILVDVGYDDPGQWDGSLATMLYIGGNKSYHGAIDEFRIYDRLLTAGEIVTLAGKSSVTQPVVTGADVDEDGDIDLVDFAGMASMWLGEDLWPN